MKNAGKAPGQYQTQILLREARNGEGCRLDKKIGNSHEGGGGVKLAKGKRAIIKDALVDQLENQGVIGRHFYDLIEDYLQLWDIKNSLFKDIKERGVSVYWENSPTQSGYKKNDSITELIKVNAQMLKILQQLNLKVDESISDDDDDDF